jgi:2-oxoglutarate dehydrogenase E1 component
MGVGEAGNKGWVVPLVSNEIFDQTSFLYGGNASYLEGMQDRFTADPASVDPQWREFFESLNENQADLRQRHNPPDWRRSRASLPQDEITSVLAGDPTLFEKKVGDRLRGKAGAVGATVSEADIIRATRDTIRALMMVRAYRTRGHLCADLDPLGIEKPGNANELDPSAYGFAEADWDRRIFVDNVLGTEFSSVRDLLAILKRTYCQTIGYEFMHISDPIQRAWIQQQVEGPGRGISTSAEEKRSILNTLVQVKGYERYLDKKYVGTTRFGLDGAEATIPALDAMIAGGVELGVREVVLGMAHRGRLNVLAQVLLKPHRAIFHEFKGGSFLPEEVEGSGDVKYHLGASSDRDFNGRVVHLSLTANPSHLEAVDPVCLGKVRAKQDQLDDREQRVAALPLLIHGDAAFAGQGVVAECFSLSGLKGYRTGGSLHFIINNQIGFTTDPGHSRSSPYPSDLAKMVEAPIFHVNGDDPEAVVHVAKLAIQFRQRFHKPVVIDMFCFRLYGHNEGDEPSFTQPVMYKAIRAHQSTLAIYGTRLIEEGLVTQSDIDKASADWVAHLDAEFEASQTYRPDKADWLDGHWQGLKPEHGIGAAPQRVQTGVAFDRLKVIGEAITVVPTGLRTHKTVQRFMDGRKEMVASSRGLDWAMAEALALGSLLDEGTPVRLSGQDSERGTFAQRHSVLADQDTGERYTPLKHVRDGQARCEIINSLLSEEAVLAFEYGYTLAEPNALVLWEAQYGDFANGAQVVFDQFISSGERKWLRMSGLVCLLPHGYEGQGPEHSSARLERYLQSSAEDNWQVANCTTPANYFHILRRQMRRDFRKPLILMTPKSLLRYRRAKSDMADLAEGSGFHRILKDGAETRPGEAIKLVEDEKIRRVILCSGKVYYDLYEEREKRGIADVYLLRIEQLYPFPTKSVIMELKRFGGAEVVWCQEEPRNMGAWTFVDPYLEWALHKTGGRTARARYVGRAAAASPAVGATAQHTVQLAKFLEQAFAT